MGLAGKGTGQDGGKGIGGDANVETNIKICFAFRGCYLNESEEGREKFLSKFKFRDVWAGWDLGCDLRIPERIIPHDRIEFVQEQKNLSTENAWTTVQRAYRLHYQHIFGMLLRMGYSTFPDLLRWDLESKDSKALCTIINPKNNKVYFSAVSLPEKQYDSCWWCSDVDTSKICWNYRDKPPYGLFELQNMNIITDQWRDSNTCLERKEGRAYWQNKEYDRFISLVEKLEETHNRIRQEALLFWPLAGSDLSIYTTEEMKLILEQLYPIRQKHTKFLALGLLSERMDHSLSKSSLQFYKITLEWVIRKIVSEFAPELSDKNFLEIEQWAKDVPALPRPGQ